MFNISSLTFLLKTAFSLQMSEIIELKNGYPGDIAWKKFVAVHRPAWAAWEEKALYIEALGDEEFAIVLTAKVRKEALDWFKRPIGALDKRSAFDVMHSEKAGKTIIRSLLMRLPL